MIQWQIWEDKKSGNLVLTEADNPKRIKFLTDAVFVVEFGAPDKHEAQEILNGLVEKKNVLEAIKSELEHGIRLTNNRVVLDDDETSVIKVMLRVVLKLVEGL